MSNLDLIFLILSTFTFVCGLLGNLFIASIIILQKHMQTKTNWFVFNLCVCDLLIVVIVLPYNTIIPKIDWPFGLFACQYIAPVLELFAGVCVLTHTSLSVARFVVLKSSMRGKMLTMKHVRITLFLVWLVPFITLSVAAMPGLMGKPTLEKSNGQLYCSILFVNKDVGMVYKLTNFLLTYILPMSSTGFAYFKINRIVSKNMKSLDGHMSEHALQNRRTNSRRMNRALMTMYLVFGVTTLPLQTYYLLTIFEYIPNNDTAWITFQFLLAFFYGQVVTNPFVLFYMSEEYRKAIYRLPVFVCRPRVPRRMSIRYSLRRKRGKSRGNSMVPNSPATKSSKKKFSSSTPKGVEHNHADVSNNYNNNQPRISNGYIPIETFMIANTMGYDDTTVPNENVHILPNENLKSKLEHTTNCNNNSLDLLGNDSLDLEEELEKAKLLYQLVSLSKPSSQESSYRIPEGARKDLVSFNTDPFDDGKETDL